MEKLTIQSLNLMFDHISQESNTIVFMKSRDNDRQLYVSQTFKDVWGRPADELYNNPLLWGKTLYEGDKERITAHLEKRTNHPESLVQDRLLYRVRDTKNQVKFLDSAAYLIVDEKNIEIAYFGITKEVLEAEWQAKLTNQNKTESMEIDSFKNYLFNILKNESHLRMKPTQQGQTSTAQRYQHKVLHNNQVIPLTERELECLHYLILGKSAKQTASILNVSSRTVEFHLNNIKDKAFCRSKIELLSKTLVDGK